MSNQQNGSDTNAHPVDTLVMCDGDMVSIKLYGDENWYSGVVIKARKQWVKIDYNNILPEGFIADENSIEKWDFIKT